ncbi:hypothetical protein [Brachybacterium hainanense]|uniref:Uncharacterized protein n=1 Tax=Brachybacterium hainanense TaxID=1541174 RepID=A0ABV6RD70_9MICO
MDDYLKILKDSERDLLREVEPARMKKLDEDELIDLHQRIRRARTKHTTNYRRAAAKNVEKKGGRGAAYPRGSKARHRAEAFEEALSRVSARLAKVSHRESERLKGERLAQAQSGRGTGPKAPKVPGTGKAAGTGRARQHVKTTGGTKRDAASSAKGRARQAKKDG